MWFKNNFLLDQFPGKFNEKTSENYVNHQQKTKNCVGGKLMIEICGDVPHCHSK